MQQDFSNTCKFWYGVKIEIRFDGYAIQFDDGQWKAIVVIESLDGKRLPFANKDFIEIIIEAETIDAAGGAADFALDYLNSNRQISFFKASKFPKQAGFF